MTVSMTSSGWVTDTSPNSWSAPHGKHRVLKTLCLVSSRRARSTLTRVWLPLRKSSLRRYICILVRTYIYIFTWTLNASDSTLVLAYSVWEVLVGLKPPLCVIDSSQAGCWETGPGDRTASHRNGQEESDVHVTGGQRQRWRSCEGEAEREKEKQGQRKQEEAHQTEEREWVVKWGRNAQKVIPIFCPDFICLFHICLLHAVQSLNVVQKLLLDAFFFLISGVIQAKGTKSLSRKKRRKRKSGRRKRESDSRTLKREMRLPSEWSRKTKTRPAT